MRAPGESGKAFLLTSVGIATLMGVVTAFCSAIHSAQHCRDWYGTARYGMVWSGIVCYGMVRYYQVYTVSLAKAQGLTNTLVHSRSEPK